MEYCNGGSLLSILERPENIYGMPEKDFLCLLHDLGDCFSGSSYYKKNFMYNLVFFYVSVKAELF